MSGQRGDTLQPVRPPFSIFSEAPAHVQQATTIKDLNRVRTPVSKTPFQKHRKEQERKRLVPVSASSSPSLTFAFTPPSYYCIN